jgi:hypothetical protein
MSDHETAPHADVTQLSRALENALEQNRKLFEEITRFTKDETLRLAHNQMNHAGQAFSHFREREGMGGLIGAQQEWIKQMMQEYANLSLRYAEMFRTLTQHMQSHVESATSDFKQRVEEAADDLGQMQQAMTPSQSGIHVEHPHMPAE